MALVTVEGVFHNGQVELAEQPDGVEGARVIVTFLTSNGAGEAAGEHGTEPYLPEISEEERQQAIRRVLANMESGLNLGGGPYYENREELYEERLKRFDHCQALF